MQSPSATSPSCRRSPVTSLGKAPSAQQYPGSLARFKQPFQKGLPAALPRRTSSPLPPGLRGNWDWLSSHCSLKTGAEAGAQEQPVRSLLADASLGSCRQWWESSLPLLSRSGSQCSAQWARSQSRFWSQLHKYKLHGSFSACSKRPLGLCLFHMQNAGGGHPPPPVLCNCGVVMWGLNSAPSYSPKPHLPCSSIIGE